MTDNNAKEYVDYTPGLNTKKSWELYQRAIKVIPGGGSSHARCWSYMGVPYPLNFVRGKGSKMWDADGNKYTDYCAALGPNILGHAHPAINKAVKEQLEKGLALYVGTNELEIQLAEKIIDMCPHVDMLRFSTSGTEATLHSIKFARAYTGKDKVLKFEGHYHGWHDYVMVSNFGVPALGPIHAPYNVPGNWGIPVDTMKSVITLPWNNLEVLEKTIKRRANEIATVITEPVMMNTGCIPPKEGYLNAMQELCEENDIVFILDEVLSGFRMAPGGAAEFYNLKPDLCAYAKALGAGYPVSAIGGKKEIMQDVVPGKLFHGGTQDAQKIIMAVALATLNTLSANDNAAYGHLNKLSKMLQDGYDDAIEKTNTQGFYQGEGAIGGQLYFTELKEVNDYRDFLKISKTKFPQYQMELLKRGIFVHPLQSEHEFISVAHTEEDIEEHLSATVEALKAVA